jgi:transglutaminase superfamily protein
MRARQASWGSVVHLHPVRLRLSQLWWAVRVGMWLCGLPRRLRRQGLPTLLHQLTPAPGRTPRRGALALDHAVRVVRRVCRLWLFCGPRFPQLCLRQALALYDTLSRQGYPVTIQVGVDKVGGALQGHSWVTIGGTPVGERDPTQRFTVIYAYPAATAQEARNRSMAGDEPPYDTEGGQRRGVSW